VPKLYNENILIDGSCLWHPDPKSNLPLDQTPGWNDMLKYESDIVAMLDRIRAYSTASIVFDAIRSALPRTLRIVPYTAREEQNPDLGVCNAYVNDKLQIDDPQPDDDSESEETDWGWIGLFRTRGNGTDAIVHYDIDRWDPHSPKGCNGARVGYGANADEILLHEVCHAQRRMLGQMRYGVWTYTSPGYYYENLEEFYAIVVANMYMCEKGQTTYRQDHAGFNPLPSSRVHAAGIVDENTNVGFLAARDNVDCIKQLMGTPAGACTIGRLAGLSTKFNPLREYKENGTKWMEKYNL
jgi:hypothetical protein